MRGLTAAAAVLAAAWTGALTAGPAVPPVLTSTLHRLRFEGRPTGPFKDPLWSGTDGTFVLRWWHGRIQLHAAGTGPRPALRLEREVALPFAVRCRFRLASGCPGAGLSILGFCRIVFDGPRGMMEILREDGSGPPLAAVREYPLLVGDPDDFVCTALAADGTLSIDLDGRPACSVAVAGMPARGRAGIVCAPDAAFAVEDFAVYAAAPRAAVRVPDAARTLPGGLSSWLPFEGGALGGCRGTVRPRVASAGSPAPVFEPGGGVRLGAGSSLTVRSWDLLGTSGRGTVAFRVSPGWAPSDAPVERVLMAAGAMRLTAGADGVLRFGVGRSGATLRRAASVWRSGVPRHCAVSWDGSTGATVLYLDGRPLAYGMGDRADARPGFVSLATSAAPGIYGELGVWNRPLEPGEVAALAAPGPVIRAALAGAPVPPPPADPPVVFSPRPLAEPVRAVVAPGETFVAAIPVANPGAAPWEGEIRFTLLDVRHRARGSSTLRVVLKPKETKDLSVPFAAPEKGIFKVRASVRQGKDVWERDVASFAGWPVPDRPPDPESFQGLHVTAWERDGRFLAQAARLGFVWNRDHNMVVATWWPNVEPEPGSFEWLADYQVENLKKHGMRLLGQFMGTPYWAAAAGPLKKQTLFQYPYNALPKIEPFRTYVYETVKRYRGYIRHWEIWNEPHTSVFWRGTPEQYAEFVQAACEEARRADPSCTLMAGGFSTRPEEIAWNERMAKAGGLKSLDAISIHWDTPGSSAATAEVYERLKTALERFEGWAREYGPGRPLPVWNSEGSEWDLSWLQGGPAYENRVPPEKAAEPYWLKVADRCIVRSAAIQQSLGIVRQFLHLANGVSEEEVGSCSFYEYLNVPRPKMMAWAAMAAELDRTVYAGTVRRPEAEFWAVVHRSVEGPRSVVLWWAGDGYRAAVRADWPGRVAAAVDLMGNERPPASPPVVAEESSYLRVEAPAEAVLAALRAARLTVLASPSGPRAGELPPPPRTAAYPAVRPGSAFPAALGAAARMRAADDPSGLLAALPGGRRTFLSVPFDLPAAGDGRTPAFAAVRGGTAYGYPDRIEGIPLGFAASRLYFLQGASGAFRSRETVAHCVVRYADGGSVEIPVTVGVNTDSFFVPGDGDSRPVAVTVPGAAGPAHRYLHVWEWRNPRPGEPMASFDYVSTGGAMTPVLVAVTGVR